MHRTLAIALLAACSPDGDPDLRVERAIPADIAPDVQEVALANNQFALDALAILPQAGPNQFFSPFSISTALWMLDAGAGGETDAEIRATLHATLPGERAHLAYGAMLDSLDVGRDHQLYTLATANRLFGQQDYGFNQPFLDILNDAYGAPLEEVDFGDTEAARQRINGWVSEQTDAKIPELLEPGDLSGSTKLSLVNAILFKGNWVHPFDPAKTKPAPFEAEGGAFDVDMMTKSEDIATAEITGGRVGLLPFRGNDLSMVVILPNEPNGLPALESALTAEALETAIAAAALPPKGGDTMTVALPKFAFETSFDLAESLQALGIRTAFSEAADLSGIAPGLFVSSAVHKAVIAVDEVGAEAAAATAINLDDSAPAEFRADRPFAFVIYDHVTHNILFLGRVNDPR